MVSFNPFRNLFKNDKKSISSNIQQEPNTKDSVLENIPEKTELDLEIENIQKEIEETNKKIEEIKQENISADKETKYNLNYNSTGELQSNYYQKLASTAADIKGLDLADHTSVFGKAVIARFNYLHNRKKGFEERIKTQENILTTLKKKLEELQEEKNSQINTGGRKKRYKRDTKKRKSSSCHKRKRRTVLKHRKH